MIASTPKRLIDSLSRISPRVTVRSDRKSTRLNSSHSQISYAVFCLKKKKKSIAAISVRGHVGFAPRSPKTEPVHATQLERRRVDSTTLPFMQHWRLPSVQDVRSYTH